MDAVAPPDCVLATKPTPSRYTVPPFMPKTELPPDSAEGLFIVIPANVATPPSNSAVPWLPLALLSNNPSAPRYANVPPRTITNPPRPELDPLPTTKPPVKAGSPMVSEPLLTVKLAPELPVEIKRLVPTVAPPLMMSPAFNMAVLLLASRRSVKVLKVTL